MEKFKLFASIIVLLTIAVAGDDADKEKIKLFIEKTSSLARIVNGIALEAGILESKIPMDKVLSEWLRVQGNGIDELQTFDKTAMNRFITALQAVETGLTDDSEALEKELITMGKMARAAKLIPNTLNVSGTDFSPLNKLKSYQGGKLYSLDIPKVMNDLISAIRTSQGDLAPSQNSLINFRSDVKKLIGIEGLNDLLKNLEPFVVVVELFDLISSNPTLVYQPLNSSTLIPNANLLNAVLPDKSLDLNLIQSFLASRIGYEIVDRIFTAGFVDGYSDIDKLAADVKDEWLTGLFGERINQPALSKLKNFVEGVQGLDESWSPKLNEKSLKSVKSIVKWVRQQSASNTTTADLSLLSNIPQNMPTLPTGVQSTDYSAEKAAMEEIKILKAKFDLISKINKLMDDANFRTFDEMDDTDHIPELRRVLSFIRSMSPLLKKFRTLDGKKISEHASTILTANATIQGLESAAIYTSSNNFIISVYNKKDELKSMGDTAMAIGQLRRLKKTPVADDLKSVVDLINNSEQKFTAIRDVAKEIRSQQKSKEMVEILKLKELQNDAKAVGDALTAVVSMEKAFDKKEQFEIFTKQGTGTALSTAIGQVTDVEKKNELIEGWGDFEVYANNLDMMMQSLVQKRGKIKEVKDLASVWNSFKKLRGIPSPDADLPLRLAVLAELHQVTQDAQLPPIIAALQKIAPLDLDFSRFDSALSNSNGTLKHVRDVFEKGVRRNQAAAMMQRSKKPRKPMNFYGIGGRKYEGFFTFLIVGLPTFFAAIFLLSLCCSIKTHKDLTASDRDEDEEEKPKPKPKTKKTSKASKNQKSKNSQNKKTSSVAKKGSKRKRSAEEGSKSKSKSRVSGGCDADYKSFYLESETSDAADNNFLVHRRQ